MIEICKKKCAIFKTGSQRLADQARTMIKKGWFSDFEILEIHQQINRESSPQDFNRIIKTLNTEKQKPSNRPETQSNCDRNELMLRRNRNTGMDDKRKDLIDSNRPKKGNAPCNYRPIMCLPMMWKRLTVQIREEIYYSLMSRGLFPEEIMP